MLSQSLSCVQLKHLSSAIRSISNHRHVSKTTINLSVMETPSQQCRNFKEFKTILSRMILTGFIKNKFAPERLLEFSTDLSFIHVDYSLQIFNVIDNPDASIYNIMLRAYVRRIYPHRAINFYKLMLNRNVSPNVYTYPFVVEACAIWDYRFEGTQVHNHVLKLGFGSDVHVRSTLVDMYADCSMLDDARKVFDEGPMMGSFVWYSLLEGYIRFACEEAEYIYSLMPEKDTRATNSMIVFFQESGEFEKAEQLINEIPENDTVSWSELIYCFQSWETREMYEEAFDIFIRMHANGITIDELVVEAVLLVCTKFAGLEDIEMGKLIHCLVVKIGIESDVELQNSLIDMYNEFRLWGKTVCPKSRICLMQPAGCISHQSS